MQISGKSAQPSVPVCSAPQEAAWEISVQVKQNSARELSACVTKVSETSRKSSCTDASCTSSHKCASQKIDPISINVAQAFSYPHNLILPEGIFHQIALNYDCKLSTPYCCVSFLSEHNIIFFIYRLQQPTKTSEGGKVDVSLHCLNYKSDFV